MKVFVYFNLKKKVWSVMSMEGPRKGHVIAHRESVALKDCQFRVSEAGRQRVLREKRKNVHAGVLGQWTEPTFARRCTRAVTYNPYEGPTFVERASRTPVHQAPCALLADRQVFVPA